MDFDREQAVEAVEKYREYFSVRGLYENEVYPGIEKLLKCTDRTRKEGLSGDIQARGVCKTDFGVFSPDRVFHFYWRK